MRFVEHALACARAGARLLRCLVAPARAPAPPPPEHEWRPVPGLTREAWEYLHHGELFAFVRRLSAEDLADLNDDHKRMGLHEGGGFRPWYEGFRIEWVRSELRSDPLFPELFELGESDSISHCGSFETVEAMCRIHAQVHTS